MIIEQLPINEFIFLNNILYTHLNKTFAKNQCTFTGTTDGKSVIDTTSGDVLKYGLTPLHFADDDWSKNKIELKKYLDDFEAKGYWQRHQTGYPWSGILIPEKILEIKNLLTKLAPTYTKTEEYKGYTLTFKFLEHQHTPSTRYEYWTTEIDNLSFGNCRYEDLTEMVDIYLRNKQVVEKFGPTDIYVLNGTGSCEGGLVFIKKEQLSEYLRWDYEFLCTLEELPTFIRNHPHWEEGVMDEYHFME